MKPAVIFAILRDKPNRVAGIYIHIPFCKSKCSYCDFYSCTSTEMIGGFVDALLREMRDRRNYLAGEPVRTIYFGGGTPSLLSIGQIRSILDEIYDVLAPNPEEITLEANPDDLSPEYLTALAQTPINRLSIGIQSFDDAHLKFMNRRHTATQAENAVRNAQAAGFRNISADLIFGIPGMDDDTWEENIDKMLSLDIQHISAYHLTIEEGTRFGRLAAAGRLTPVPDDASERQYAILCEKLGKAGFEHYEISNFAIPGHRARHNGSYWKGEPYLGLGPSAHSYDGRRRDVCTADTPAYINSSPSREMFETETLTRRDMQNEYVMVRLRCAEGIDIAEFGHKFGKEKLKELQIEAQKFIENGLLEIKKGYIYVPTKRFLLSDRVISELFDI